MAMSKEEQRAAAERILAKEPMTDEEMRVYEQLVKRPEDYRPPDPQTGERVCGLCGEVFETTNEGGMEVTALQKFSDHQTEHQPSPGQWAEAHRRTQRAPKERES